MVYDENSFLQGIALGRSMKGIDIVNGEGKFWGGENLLTENQRNLSNWHRVQFRVFENGYYDGENFLVVTTDNNHLHFHNRLYIAVNLQAYTLYVFTGLYRSVTGTTIVESYEPEFYGERNAVLTQTPGSSKLSRYPMIDMSPPLYTEASETFQRYSAFAYANSNITAYLVIDFGKYQDAQTTKVRWKDLCFAQM